MSITGQRIKRYRELAGMNQDELAALMGKSGKTIVSHWENGKVDPSLAQVRKMAEIFNTTVAQLVGEAPILEEPRENYVMVRKDDLIGLQWKALEMEEERVRNLKEQLEKALNPYEEPKKLSQADIPLKQIPESSSAGETDEDQ
ncbi:helix-turn-helix transcriptional regulator [Dyadobacter sp. CY323]|uniref:helix-turn-helix transcriptional regulator n=1 Tax=Dyadobacter sp. CY323 TaxID=2907302 RepID=UPI001F1C1209|nr:helix-turn-helix transcriptional regulator [Dyadobacter sp. CY323]MCE6990012.1 helix-turn-helix transcriptional regulator [Dyadobacter sp. CY323]